MYLVTAAEMRALDGLAINKYGIPGIVLMENAGRGAFEILKKRFHDGLCRLSVAVVAGPGNNGGDGYVMARYLLNEGADVRVFLLAPKAKIKGDALTNLTILENLECPIVEAFDKLEECSLLWMQSDVVIDAILGTGLSAEVKPPYAEAIDLLNESGAYCVSVDIPSGLDSDTGHVLGTAIQADLTVTFGFRKLGTVLGAGIEYCGAVEVIDIGIPTNAVEEMEPKAWLYEQPAMEFFLAPRINFAAHKGNFGHVLVIGGSPGKTGAPAMSARAASRMGAGLVTAAVPASLNPIVETKLTEEMTEPVAESEAGYLGTDSIETILSLSKDKQCVVIGAGMSTKPGARAVVTAILENYDGTCIIDADGLNVLASDTGPLKTAKCRVIITPHPGEMGRLIQKPAGAVQADRLTVARQCAIEHKVWVVLKGHGTIVASPDGAISVNTTGNSWMANGGQGDALSGILAGLISQGVPIDVAVPLGVYLHGKIADRIVENRGPAPVLAMDIIEELPKGIWQKKNAGSKSNDDQGGTKSIW